MSPTAEPLYGSNTAKAVQNFPISGRVMPLSVIYAIARIKRAAAVINATRAESPVTHDMAAAIGEATEAVLAGVHDDQFPVDVYQTGSGTSSNMNVNEVLATLAGRSLGTEVHPNDHLNASQSSNDVVPTAIRMAALAEVETSLLPALRHLSDALAVKGAEFDDVAKAGRTHLMDATPITLGQEFGGWEAQVDEAAERVRSTMTRVGRLPLGGTATGNGVGTFASFAATVIGRLVEETGLELTEAPNHFAVQGSQDALVELSAALRGVAVTLYKVANDIRWLSSGPRTGLREITLPELQPGSSIMPGKVNPVLCESVMQVAATVIGNDATVAFAGTQGSLELNTFLPVIGDALLDSIGLLSAVVHEFTEHAVAGIEANRDQCRRYAETTPSLATSLNPLIGYDEAAAVAKESLRSDRTIREVVLERGLLTAEELDEALDIDRIARHSGHE